MSKIKVIIILFGDIVVLYGSLALTLLLRYEFSYFKESFLAHLRPFSLIFFVWILLFYLMDLYQDKTLKNNFSLSRALFPAIVISVIVSILFFYGFSPFFKLTPKTNLLLFAVIFGILDFGWRITLIKMFVKSGWRTKLLFINESETFNETMTHLKSNPHLGYDAAYAVKNEPNGENAEKIEKAITSGEIDVIVIPPHIIKKDVSFVKFIYKLLPLKIAVMDSISFYEMVFQKVPLNELEEGWFVEKIASRRNFYDTAKRATDIVLSLILSIILLPLIVIIAVLVKTTSKGEIIYKQERIGKNGNLFILYKFRTMRINHNGPLWTAKNDERLTAAGRILRYTHLDELPQLYNILKGDLSFIGPRAERSELVEQYQKLPYYEMRHIVKPGLTGWAQIHYKPSASLEEAFEKLQYDIYYIKNRSLILDLMILIKTIRHLFIPNK